MSEIVPSIDEIVCMAEVMPLNMETVFDPEPPDPSTLWVEQLIQDAARETGRILREEGYTSAKEVILHNTAPNDPLVPAMLNIVDNLFDPANREVHRNIADIENSVQEVLKQLGVAALIDIGKAGHHPIVRTFLEEKGDVMLNSDAVRGVEDRLIFRAAQYAMAQAKMDVDEEGLEPEEKSRREILFSTIIKELEKKYHTTRRPI